MSKLERASQYQIGPNNSLIPYGRTKGTYFQVYQNPKDGQWHWKLYLAYSPQGPAARSAYGYKNQHIAKATIRTALKAMRNVVQT